MHPLNFVSYPYSHSMVMLVIWSALFALVYRTIKGWQPKAIAAVATLVFSHFVLDFITHRPDLPLTLTGSRRVGLGLSNSPMATLVIEVALFAVGTAIYVVVTRARDRIGSIGIAEFTVRRAALTPGVFYASRACISNSSFWSTFATAFAFTSRNVGQSVIGTSLFTFMSKLTHNMACTVVR